VGTAGRTGRYCATACVSCARTSQHSTSAVSGCFCLSSCQPGQEVSGCCAGVAWEAAAPSSDCLLVRFGLLGTAAARCLLRALGCLLKTSCHCLTRSSTRSSA
jgi:hypothetical protein